MSGKEIRELRTSAGLRGWQVCVAAKISRSKLCGIEQGYVVPTKDEVARLVAGIEALRRAKAELARFAANLNCPGFGGL